MMLVSLSSFSQYPAVKVIGKDTVVLMTLKQGEDINDQFTLLKDSLSALNELTLTLRKQMGSMGARNIQLSTNLSKSMDDVSTLNKQVVMYKTNYEEAENTIRFLQRDHKNTIVGLLTLLAAWTVYTSVMLNK